MEYKLTKKTEAAAPELLYGSGSRRLMLEFEHLQLNGKPDSFKSEIYVDAATFAKYAIGDTVYIGMDFVMAAPLPSYDQVKELHDDLAEDGIVAETTFRQ